MPSPDYKLECNEALAGIRKILDSPHPDAQPGEKLVRIAWLIGILPEELRDGIVSEARNRVAIGWATGVSPTKF